MERAFNEKFADVWFHVVHTDETHHVVPGMIFFSQDLTDSRKKRPDDRHPTSTMVTNKKAAIGYRYAKNTKD